MTLQDIITETRQIVQQTNPNNSQASDSMITAWANLCTMQLCSSLTTLPKESVTGIVAAEIITLPADFLKLDYVSIVDGQGLHTNSGTIDFVNFSRITSGWEDQEANKPATLVRMTDTTWMMFPKPDASWVGKAMTIIGTKLPADMSATSDVPALSPVLHPCYAHFCAWKFFLLINNPERASSEYSVFDSIRKMNQQTATNTTGSLQSFKIRGY